MKAKLKIIAAMLTWGSMGVFVRHINLPAGNIALVRAVIGLIFLLVLGRLLKKPFPKNKLISNKWVLIASGVVLGVNWIFLFEAYKHTTIAIATLSYYIAPILIAIISTIMLKEKLTPLKVLLMVTALVGLAFVSGIFGSSYIGIGDGLGIIFGVAAAVSYASFTIMNKRITGVSSMDSTITQFGIASIVLLPYTLLNTNSFKVSISWNTLLFLIILGVFHTGIAFWLFFSAVRELKAQTIAVLSYLDPVTAVLLSALLLNETLGIYQIIGACIILSSAFISGYLDEKKIVKKKNISYVNLSTSKNV